MKRTISCIVVALCGLLLSACFQGQPETGDAQLAGERAAHPSDGPMLDRVEGTRGAVIFNHGGHMGYGFACTDCHHTTEVGDYPGDGCLDCHPVPDLEDEARGGPDDNLVLVGEQQDPDLPGVPFNHYTHASKQGYKLACDSCHHQGGYVGCDSCHSELARVEDGQVVPKHKRAMHLQCGGCHDALVGRDPDSVAPVTCETCHSLRELPRLEGSLDFQRANHLQCIDCHAEVKAARPAAPTRCTGCHLADAEGNFMSVEAAVAWLALPPPPCEGDDCPEDDGGDGGVSEGAGDDLPDVSYSCENGDVLFKHSTHQDDGCEGCHPDPYEMTQSELGEEAGHAGCGRCHEEEVLEDSGSCERCHLLSEETAE